VAALEGVSFVMKDDPDKNTELGLIAQDVEAVYPELVRTGADGIKSLNYIGLTAPLIEAVKELKSENDQLRQDNEAIRARLHALENRLLAVPETAALRHSRTRPAYNN
jgi:Chaperone of endosialidase